MAKTYEVRLVSEKEWDRLPEKNPRYRHTGDSLGFTDPQHRRVYVRSTYWPELNKYLLAHELEHLAEHEATDEDEFGIRHKRAVGRSLVRNVLGPVLGLAATPFTGGLSLLGNAALQGGINAATRTASNIGAPGGQGRALGAQLGQNVVQSGLEQGGAALGGQFGPFGQVAGGATGGALGSALTGRPTGQGAVQGALAQGIPAFTSGIAPSIGATLQAPLQLFRSQPVGGMTPLQPISPAPTFSSSVPTSRLGGGLQAITFSPTPTALGAAPSPPPPPGGGGFSSLMGKANSFLGSALGGATAQGIGSFLAGQGGANQPGFDAAAAAGLLGLGEARKIPEIPNANDLASVQNIARTAGQGQALSPLGTLAQSRLSEQLTSPLDQQAALPPDVLSGIERQRQVEFRNLTAQFKAFRPGADLATDSAYRQAVEELNQRYNETTANLQLQRRQQVEQFRQQDIAQALGIDTQTLSTLAALAQNDIDQIMLKTGLDFQRASEFKQTFGQLAGLFATRALGLQSFQLPQQQTARP